MIDAAECSAVIPGYHLNKFVTGLYQARLDCRCPGKAPVRTTRWFTPASRAQAEVSNDRANGRSSHPIHDPFDTHYFRTSASIDVGDDAVLTVCPGGVDASVAQLVGGV